MNVFVTGVSTMTLWASLSAGGVCGHSFRARATSVNGGSGRHHHR